MLVPRKYWFSLFGYVFSTEYMFYKKKNHIKFSLPLNVLFYISRIDLFYFSRLCLHAMKSYS